MKVVIFGGRTYAEHEYAWAQLDKLHKEYNFTLVIDGKAKGADTIGHDWACYSGINTVRCAPEWDKFGKVAGFKRNQAMIDDYNPELAIMFPGGAGTADMYKRCINHNIKVIQLLGP